MRHCEGPTLGSDHRSFHVSSFLSSPLSEYRSWESAVGRARGYRLGGVGSFPGRVKIFLYSVAFRPALGSTQPPINNEYTKHFLRGQAAGA
jgi:hypothetical protein